MRACVGEVSVLEHVVVMILHWISTAVFWKWPKSVQVDLVTETCCHGVHQQSSAGALDIHLVCEPVPEKEI